jgi:flagellum-specific ATP synthase
LTRDLLPNEQLDLVGRARETMAIYRKNQDLITIGAYAAGSNAVIDQAIRLHSPLMDFLRQGVRESKPATESWKLLTDVMQPPPPPPADKKQRGR